MNFLKVTDFTPLFMLFCSVTLVLYFINWKSSRRNLYKMAAKIPPIEGVKRLPFFGCALYFRGDTEQLFEKFRKITKKISRPQKAWLGHKLLIIVNHPDDMEVILNSPKCLTKPYMYNMLENALGKGLLSLPVPEWKKHRKVIMPTFNQRILNKFVGVFSKQAEICVQQLKGKTGEVIDFFPFATKYGLDAVCETAMGISINAQSTSTESEIEHALHRGMEILMTRMYTIMYYYDWLYNLSSLSREESKYKKIIHKFIQEVIEKKVKNYKREVAEQKNDSNFGGERKSLAFLELLIELSENGESWTNDELRAEVSTFMFAGSDTSATVASFTLLALAIHPEIQQKCYEEVIEVIGPDRDLDCADLPKLTYLEKVIKETMRLFPVAPFITRKLDEDLEVGGCVIPKGVEVVLFIFAIHNSEVYYKDPQMFDPERFSFEETAKRHKYAYLPFSGGPRNCIGLKYGMMSVKTLVAVVLRNYKIETTYKNINEIKLKQSIIINAIDGFPIRLITRERI